MIQTKVFVLSKNKYGAIGINSQWSAFSFKKVSFIAAEGNAELFKKFMESLNENDVIQIIIKTNINPADLYGEKV
jgi:hypothetical protein